MNRRIFDLYSKNLSYYSNLTGFYICPLCFTKFSISNIDELSKEHIIPKKLGGTRLILTCKNCNKTYGSKYISKFVKNIEIERINLGLSNNPLDVEVDILENKLNAEYFHHEETHTFKIIGKRTNPRNVENVINLLKRNIPEKFNVKMKLGHSSMFSRMSLLIIAHLILFYHFGYYYLLNSSGLTIQRIIKNENHEHFICNNIELSNNPIIKESLINKCNLIICNKPDYYNNYGLVLIPLTNKDNIQVRGLLLPFLPGIKISKHYYSIKNDFQFTGVPYKFDEKVISNKLYELPGGKFQIS